jgi:ribosomal protein S18 acetylase RimI-like enzyme
MTLRPATPADVPAVLPMVDRLAALHEQWDAAKYPYLPNVGEMYRRWLAGRADDPRSVFLVAEREGRIVAFLVGTVEREIPIYRVREYGFIHDLWVDEAYRNEGVARQMVMLAVERFREIGVPQVRLDTAIPNDAARNLFKSCGFRPSMTEMLLDVGTPNTERET